MSNYQPTRFAAELTARLRGAVARYDINQAVLAALCGVSQSQFSKIIRGLRPMSVDQYAVLCDALEIHPDQLAQEVEEFLADRPNAEPSPIRLVDEGERRGVTFVRPESQMDAWALEAKRRWLEVAGSVGVDERDEIKSFTGDSLAPDVQEMWDAARASENVGGSAENGIPHVGAVDVDALRRSGVALAADERDGIEEEQERSQELP